MKRWSLLLLAAVAVEGCAVVSAPVRREAVPVGPFEEFRQRPETLLNRTVILGGEIIETRNLADGTVILVLHRPLGLGQSPRAEAPSGGRFLVRFAEYLDPVLFAPGRSVTVAGRVLGAETELVGEAPYRYVTLEGREIHLWKEPTTPPPPYWWPHDPWYPWWNDPRYGRRPWR
ncbi:MAG: Slp family lipoprotein [Deferrisomatales bacterium]|nr:Slp family lipoprotein [Deferrisomatales bacterium]